MSAFDRRRSLGDRGQVPRVELAEFLLGHSVLWVRVVSDHPAIGASRVVRMEITTDVEPPGFSDLVWDYQTMLFRSTLVAGSVVAGWIEQGRVELDDGPPAELSIAVLVPLLPSLLVGRRLSSLS